MTQAAVRPIREVSTPERKPVEPGGPIWDEAGLITFSLASGSAFLLQTMDPTIGTVVAEHSTYRTDAIGRAYRSLASVMTWVYGGEEALIEGDRLRAMHAPLKSTDEQGVTHHALSSAPYAWVVLTGQNAFVTANKYFGRKPLTRADEERMYADVVQVMRNLRVAEKEIPQTYDEYLQRFDEIVEHRLVAHPTAYDYLDTVRRIPPPLGLPKVLRPLWRAALYLPGKLQYFATVGTTPPAVRAKLGLEWTAADERKLRIIGRLVAYLLPLLPERVRYLPIAYEARRAERARGKLRRILNRRPDHRLSSVNGTASSPSRH